MVTPPSYFAYGITEPGFKIRCRVLQAGRNAFHQKAGERQGLSFLSFPFLFFPSLSFPFLFFISSFSKLFPIEPSRPNLGGAA